MKGTRHQAEAQQHSRVGAAGKRMGNGAVDARFCGGHAFFCRKAGWLVMMIPRTHVTACWRCVATCCTPSGAIPGVQGDGRISIEALAGELMAWNAGALTQAPGETEKTMALLLKHQLPRR